MPELKSTLARAVVPVAAGIAIIALMTGALWLAAAYIADNPDTGSERLLPTEWTVGPVDSLSAIIATDGPLLFQQPGGDSAARSMVIDHVGGDPTEGWRLFWAYPADRGDECAVSLERGTDTFVDCDGRTIGVDQLAVPDTGVHPRVDDGTTLVIDFRDPTARRTGEVVRR